MHTTCKLSLSVAMLAAAAAPFRRMAPAVAAAASAVPAVSVAATGSSGVPLGSAAVAAAAAFMAASGLAWCAKEDHSDMVVFSGTANLPLAQEVAEKLGRPLAAASVKRFADGEVSIRVRCASAALATVAMPHFPTPHSLERTCAGARCTLCSPRALM